jgi:hypothetical protein
MAAPTPRATANDVSTELDGSLAASEIRDRWLERAARVVNKRLPNEGDEWLLTNLEILVAAHFAFSKVTGANTDDRVKSVADGDAEVSYDGPEGPDGEPSPYWAQAVRLDDRIASTDDSFTITR